MRQQSASFWTEFLTAATPLVTRTMWTRRTMWTILAKLAAWTNTCCSICGRLVLKGTVVMVGHISEYLNRWDSMQLLRVFVSVRTVYAF